MIYGCSRNQRMATLLVDLQNQVHRVRVLWPSTVARLLDIFDETRSPLADIHVGAFVCYVLDEDHCVDDIAKFCRGYSWGSNIPALRAWLSRPATVRAYPQCLAIATGCGPVSRAIRREPNSIDHRVAHIRTMGREVRKRNGVRLATRPIVLSGAALALIGLAALFMFGLAIRAYMTGHV